MTNPKVTVQKRPKALKLTVASAATALVVVVGGVVWGVTSLLSGFYASQSPPGPSEPYSVPPPSAPAGTSGRSATSGSSHGSGSNTPSSTCDLACQQALLVHRNEGIILPRPAGTPAITQQQLDQARRKAEASAGPPQVANNGPTPTPAPTAAS